ncbi:MAG: magnesium transporter [Lachnospiraceae bacterium]|nr:magnesium transporter [Lachnospiraceae bacterium]
MAEEKNISVDNKKEEPEFSKEILALIRSNKSPKVLADELQDYHANDLATVLPVLSPKERSMVYRLLGTDDLAEVMEYADEDAAAYLDEMDPRKAADVLSHMETDQAVDLLKTTTSPKKQAWIELMDPETRKTIQSLATYSEDVIASRMTTNFVTLQSNMTIQEAMKSLIDQAAVHDNISVIYVLDDKGVYYGAVDLKELIIARRDTKLEDVITTNYPYVYADEKIDDCLEKLKEYSEESIPVLSDSNEILGVITAQDVTEVVDDEMGEDYAKLGGLSAEEDLNEPVKQSVRKRLPWLILLLFLGMLVSSVVGMFETIVAQLTILMSFQSMILDMAGNVGTQSLAVTIRVLMDEKLTVHDKVHLILKEMTVGGMNGLLLAVLAFVAIGVYCLVFKHQPVGASFAISGCIGLSLIVAMVISSFVGTAVPMFFKKVGVDPAAASGPLITTVTDMIGVVSYYGLASIVLIGILHLA